jgi:hypothetical protein
MNLVCQGAVGLGGQDWDGSDRQNVSLTETTARQWTFAIWSGGFTFTPVIVIEPVTVKNTPTCVTRQVDNGDRQTDLRASRRCSGHTPPHMRLQNQRPPRILLER